MKSMDVDGLDAFESAFVDGSDPGSDLGETGIVEDTLDLGDGPLGLVDPEMIMHEHWSAHRAARRARDGHGGRFDGT
jgi:hypothetical protein